MAIKGEFNRWKKCCRNASELIERVIQQSYGLQKTEFNKK